MYHIKDLREEIDKVDKEIVKLLEKRMGIVKKVALYKKEKSIPLLNAKREEEVINKNINILEHKEYAAYIEDIFIKIMEESKRYQKYFIENNNLYGLMGEKLGHSLSPNIHKAIFEKIQMPAHYELLEVDRENLSTVVEVLNNTGFKGVNVTIPYKVDIMNFLHEVSPEAKSIGAVNTIKFKNGKALGYNTDYFGFKKTLEKNKIDVQGKSAVILGSGGAALMVYNYLLNENSSEIILVTRNKDNVNIKRNFSKCSIINYEELSTLKDKYIIVNCTPCGMYPNIHKSPVPIGILNNFKVAMDLIYNPGETLFLKYAREQGIKGINGLYMLIAQGVASEEIWNDIIIEDEVIDYIYKALETGGINV